MKRQVSMTSFREQPIPCLPSRLQLTPHCSDGSQRGYIIITPSISTALLWGVRQSAFTCIGSLSPQSIRVVGRAGILHPVLQMRELWCREVK